MIQDKILTEIQGLLSEGKIDEVVDRLFATYLFTHPSAQNIKDYRNRVIYKLRNEFSYLPEEDAKAKSKLLIYTFMSLVSNSEGETAYNIVLLLLHLIRKGNHEQIREIVEVIKLERASRTLSNNLNSHL